MRDVDNAVLLDMLDHARSVFRSTDRVDYDEFMQNEEKYKAVILDLLQIGERASRISKVRRLEYSAISWERVIGFRHRAVHDYNNIDLPMVWSIVKLHIPELISMLEDILREESEI